MPRGAHAILEARRKRMKPAVPVIVSLVGPLREANPVVVVEEPSHDWRFMAQLDTYVFVAPKAEHVPETLLALARVVSRINVWDVEQKRGMEIWPVWKGLHVPEVFGLRGSIEERASAIFVRWARVRWFEYDNLRFAGVA